MKKKLLFAFLAILNLALMSQNDGPDYQFNPNFKTSGDFTLHDYELSHPSILYNPDETVSSTVTIKNLNQTHPTNGFSNLGILYKLYGKLNEHNKNQGTFRELKFKRNDISHRILSHRKDANNDYYICGIMGENHFSSFGGYIKRFNFDNNISVDIITQSNYTKSIPNQTVNSLNNFTRDVIVKTLEKDDFIYACGYSAKYDFVSGPSFPNYGFIFKIPKNYFDGNAHNCTDCRDVEYYRFDGSYINDMIIVNNELFFTGYNSSSLSHNLFIGNLDKKTTRSYHLNSVSFPGGGSGECAGHRMIEKDGTIYVTFLQHHAENFGVALFDHNLRNLRNDYFQYVTNRSAPPQPNDFIYPNNIIKDNAGNILIGANIKHATYVGGTAGLSIPSEFSSGYFLYQPMRPLKGFEFYNNKKNNNPYVFGMNRSMPNPSIGELITLGPDDHLIIGSLNEEPQKNYPQTTSPNREYYHVNYKRISDLFSNLLKDNTNYTNPLNLNESLNCAFKSKEIQNWEATFTLVEEKRIERSTEYIVRTLQDSEISIDEVSEDYPMHCNTFISPEENITDACPYWFRTIEMSLNPANQLSETLCKGETKTLTAVQKNHFGTTTIQWFKDGAPIPGANDLKIDITEAGSYHFEGTRNQTTGTDCLFTSDALVINSPIDASIETEFNIDAICQGEVIQLKSRPLNQTDYEWSKDNSVISNNRNIDINTPGTYTVKVTMNNGCVDEVSKQIYQKGLTLKQTASKTTPALNETITLTGTVCNFETTAATNVPFEAILPVGFDFVGSSVVGLSFNPTTRKISYTIPTIARRVGSSAPCITISYQVKATNLCKVNHCMQVTSTACGNLAITDCKDYNSQPIHSVAITAPRFEVCNNNTITMNTVLNPLAGATTYQWKLNGNNIPNATTNTYTTSNTGLYTVSATRNNCTVVSEAKEVKESTPIVPNATVVDNLCLGKTNGSISLLPTGGSAPYTYQWSNSATTSNISNLAVGNYTVTVKDKYNCTVSNSYVIKHQKSISFTFGRINPSECNRANGGTSMIVGIDATLPISFKNITNNTDIVNTDATNLTAGIYTIRMTDASGCIVENNVTIGRTNVPFDVDITKTALCSATPDGKIVLSPKGLAPHTYLWNNGSTTATVNNLAAGSYTVTVTDANLCTTTKTIDIVPSPAIGTPTISSSIVSCMPNDNKSIYTATFTGGVAPFVYQWSPTPISTNLNNATINSNSGNITVTITDANGCKKTSSTIANSLSSYTQLGEGYSKPTRSSASSLFPSNVLNSNKVVIKGNFTIDQAATIQNAEVILENYPTSSPLKLGKITSTLPNTSGDFKLINCTVKTCNNELAEGIEVNNSNIWMQGNKVYDMITALSFKNNVKLFLNSNLFENNRIGIEYATTVGTLTTFMGPNPSLINHFTNNSFIGGNLKTNRNTSISQYPNTIGGNTNYSYIGIASRNNLGFNIGKSSSLLNSDGSYSQIYPMNTFYKINNGIVVSQGNYNIVNFRIYDYNDEVVPPITPTKKGIVAINTANIEPTVAIGAKIVVKGENNSTQFFSLTKAVETFGYELELSNAIFHVIENNAIEYSAYSNRTSNKFKISYNNFISTKNQAFNYIDNSNKPTIGIFSNNKVNGIGTTNNALINFNKIQLTASTSESLAVQYNEIKNSYNRVSLNINNFRNVNYANNTHTSNGANVNITATISNCNTYNESNNIYNTTYTGSGKNDPIISNSFSTNNIYPLDALYDNNVNATISCNDYYGFSNILFSRNNTNLNLTNNDFTGKKHRILIDANCTFPQQTYKGNRFSTIASNGMYDIFSKVSSNSPLFITNYGQTPINTSNYQLSIPVGCSGNFYFFPNSLRLSPSNVMGTISNSNIKEPYNCCTPTPKSVRADGLNDDKNNTKLSIYPNPTTDGELNIEFPSEINSKISFYLFDLNANKVFFEEQNIEGKKAKISVNNLSSGYYILRIFNGNEHLQDEKINFKMREF